MAASQVIEIRVCFEDRLHNTTIRVATEDRSEARRIARLWAEQAGGDPVTRTIIQQEGVLPDWQVETQIVDGVKIWLPLF